MSVCTGGDRYNSLNRGFVGSTAIIVCWGVASQMVVPSSLGTGGAEPSSIRAHPWPFLLVSSQYVYGVDC
jgi:hypothetical protein